MPIRFSVRFRQWLRTTPVLILTMLFPPLFPLASYAQRLPQTALPQRYTLTLAPNLKTATFYGDETIDLILLKPARTVTLNSFEIRFGTVTVELGGRTLPAEVSLDAARQEATFHFAEVLPAGPLRLKVKYTGVLNSDLRGFYLSKTALRNYAVTQFEPTDARRAFPCFDEPAFKAEFDITLIVAKDDTAISNTNIASDTPGPLTRQHTLRFARTPKMSTYLVAFLVGDFHCLSGASDDVPIRVCATPEHVQDGRFALSAAEFFLHYYDDYFGIKYPMPKLDMVALPDFEAGAMENFGAITYRETALLIDPRIASVAAQKVVALDVAHEMAHQWFGDMVTMSWWNNIWLNEGFATWMENKPVALWRPDWHIPEDVAADLNNTLDVDAQKITRTIRAPADTPDEINEMFDAITYGKAGAVLLMVENYVGADTFRNGVRKYLRAHMYSNATAEDFWNTQREVSHKPVDKIMESLVTQPGEPLVTFALAHGGKVKAAQQRFFLNPRTGSETASPWTIPVCIETAGFPACQILKRKSQTLDVPEAPIFYGDAGGKGYYRSHYASGDYQEIVKGVERGLHPAERIGLLGSQWALTRAQRATIGDFMRLCAAVKDDSSADVLETAAGAIHGIDQQIASTSEQHRLLASWVRKTYAPAFARLAPLDEGDKPEQRELRATLFSLLGGIGRDPAAITQAKQMAGQYLRNPGSVDATLAAAALGVAAQNGDQSLFDRIQKVSEAANNPQLHRQTLFALALFRDPELVERALSYAVSGRVRNQDSGLLIVSELSSRWTQDQAWRFIQQNWPKVQAQITISTGEYLVASMGNFCSAERSLEVTNFFSQHKVPASEQALVRARQSIADCIDLRSAQEPNLDGWLNGAGR